MEKTYIAIDLKSFYASCECRLLNLDPLDTNLVVADNTRTNKTVCLAVTPSLKSYQISGRARLYEVESRIKHLNQIRLSKIKDHKFKGKSSCYSILEKNLDYEINYIVASPKMATYMQISNKIYSIYLKYISKQDIQVYSIDEVFIDVTPYLNTYKTTAHNLALKIIKDVLKQTGITATCGIGPNLFLAKVAMDVVAKKMKADKDGVRIASLNEITFRQTMWDHLPITDIWRIGKGYEKRLNQNGMYTLGDIAIRSIENEDDLYRIFGINAEILIDHAWGIEPCTIQDIKNYKPTSTSISLGQVLHEPYNYEDTRLILKEMLDMLVLQLVDTNKTTNHLTITIGYDIENIKNGFLGPTQVDPYGRVVPKSSHGSINLNNYSSSLTHILEKALILFENICEKTLTIRRVNIAFCNLIVYDPNNIKKPKQFTIFDDSNAIANDIDKNNEFEKKEHNLQKSLIKIKKKYGKNSVLKLMNYQDKATTRARNKQIGGHKA